ncbi:hypothetical protein J2S74_002887 [Evansella vedderi]|uniref:Uncharacterized protein n=2 Tax=Evansella vedderi TaxID=38282 RepID=A0ABT9ZZH6_9BACI|nr:hypothetical protein [Evansella vedderi]
MYHNKQGWKKTFKHLLKLDYCFLMIKLPQIEVLRGEVLLDDVKRIGELEDDFNLDVGLLIGILYEQFLDQIRCERDLEVFAKYLIRRVDEIKYEPQEEKTLVQTGPNEWSLATPKRVPKKKKHEMTYIQVRIKESFVYRGEVMLYDMDELLGGDEINFRIEEVIQVLYLDFMNNIKKGQTKETLLSVLNSFANRED